MITFVLSLLRQSRHPVVCVLGWTNNTHRLCLYRFSVTCRDPLRRHESASLRSVGADSVAGM